MRLPGLVDLDGADDVQIDPFAAYDASDSSRCAGLVCDDLDMGIFVG